MLGHKPKLLRLLSGRQATTAPFQVKFLLVVFLHTDSKINIHSFHTESFSCTSFVIKFPHYISRLFSFSVFAAVFQAGQGWMDNSFYWCENTGQTRPGIENKTPAIAVGHENTFIRWKFGKFCQAFTNYRDESSVWLQALMRTPVSSFFNKKR